MKVALCMVCLFFASAAFAQSGVNGAVLSNEPSIFRMPTHPERAIQTPMGEEQNVMTTFNFVHARGERPLWEVAPSVVQPTPLGAVARMLRKQHAGVKKATIVWEN